MDNLCGLPTDAARRRALRELPRGLDATYDRILERIEQSNQENRLITERVLKWLFDGSHTLSNEQLCEILALDRDGSSRDVDAQPDVDTILRCCPSLLRLGNRDRLEFAHFTVKEYLSSERLRNNSALSRYFCNDDAVTVYKARACLNYLRLPDFAGHELKTRESCQELQMNSPFYSHAARYWHEYFSRIINSGETLDAVLELFCSPCFETWKKIFLCQVVDYTSSDKEYAYIGFDALTLNAGPQHFAALLHLHEMTEALALRGFDVNQGCRVGTPLSFALSGLSDLLKLEQDHQLETYTGARSRITTIETLIRLGANVNERIYLECTDTKAEYCTPLCAACRRDQKAAVVLLKAGATPDRHTVQVQLQRLLSGKSPGLNR